MTEILSICLLSLIALSLVATLIYREGAHDKEREGLMDRINAPRAAEIAATERLVGPPPPPVEPAPPTYIPFTDDLALIDQLEGA